MFLIRSFIIFNLLLSMKIAKEVGSRLKPTHKEFVLDGAT